MRCSNNNCMFDSAFVWVDEALPSGKEIKAQSPNSAKGACFTCGEFGHWSKDCSSAKDNLKKKSVDVNVMINVNELCNVFGSKSRILE